MLGVAGQRFGDGIDGGVQAWCRSPGSSRGASPHSATSSQFGWMGPSLIVGAPSPSRSPQAPPPRSPQSSFLRSSDHSPSRSPDHRALSLLRLPVEQLGAVTAVGDAAFQAASHSPAAASVPSSERPRSGRSALQPGDSGCPAGAPGECSARLDKLARADMQNGEVRCLQTAANDEEEGLCAGRDVSLVRLSMLAAGWAACALTWVCGVVVCPTLEIHVLRGTRFSHHIVRSLAATLVELFQHQRLFSLGVLMFCSVIVPVAKLVSTLGIVLQLFTVPARHVHARCRWAVWVLEVLASYQLVDLYVGLLFIAFFNSDTSEASLLPGFYFFFAYCIVSVACSEVLSGAFTLCAQQPLSGAQHDCLQGTACLSASEADGLLAAKDMPPLEEAWQGPTTNAAREPETATPLREVVDTKAVAFFTSVFVLLMGLCAFSEQPLLEVRALWSGVSVDRIAWSARELFGQAWPSLTEPGVVSTLIALNFGVPVLYLSFLLLLILMPPSAGVATVFLRSAVDFLRPWATVDVFAMASLIFLLTMQDQHTLTMVPKGSLSFYVLLGAGCSFFFLRWFVPCGGEAVVSMQALPANFPAKFLRRPLFLVSAWFAVSSVVCVGVPGSTPHFEFPTLDSVCEQLLPLVDGAMREALPASFGQCQNLATSPPQPCSGRSLLVDEASADGYVQAVWLGGVNTIHLDKCHLQQRRPESETRPGMTRAPSTFRLEVGGFFQHLDLFLHARQCSTLGCAKLNSPDHCCGSSIRFSLTFSSDCTPSRGRDVLGNLSISSFDIDPMMIEQNLVDHSWVRLAVDAVDISPQVEEGAKKQIGEFLDMARILWAGRQVSVNTLLNQLVAYNSPSEIGSC